MKQICFDFNKLGVLCKRCKITKRGGWNFIEKSINVEGGFFGGRVEFFKVGKCDFTFIREMRVATFKFLIKINISFYNF